MVHSHFFQFLQQKKKTNKKKTRVKLVKQYGGIHVQETIERKLAD